PARRPQTRPCKNRSRPKHCGTPTSVSQRTSRRVSVSHRSLSSPPKHQNASARIDAGVYATIAGKLHVLECIEFISLPHLTAAKEKDWRNLLLRLSYRPSSNRKPKGRITCL